jgi:hypothetical protein
MVDVWAMAQVTQVGAGEVMCIVLQRSAAWARQGKVTWVEYFTQRRQRVEGGLSRLASVRSCMQEMAQLTQGGAAGRGGRWRCGESGSRRWRRRDSMGGMIYMG